MRLLTHNMLQCPRTGGYPLTLEALETKTVSVAFSLSTVQKMAGRVNWGVFRSAAASNPSVDLPLEVPPADAAEAVWRDVHAALLEWHVVRGTLRAPDGTAYAIREGVPNLIVADAVAPMDDPRLAIDGQVAADVAGNRPSGGGDDDDE